MPYRTVALVVAIALVGGLPAAADEAERKLIVYDNESLEEQITTLGVAHNLAFGPSLSPEPVSAIVGGSTTYATNLGLKYVPPVIRAPDTVGVEPTSTDQCSYTFTINGEAEKTRQDLLGLITQADDDLNFYDAFGTPGVYHVNTDVQVSLHLGDDLTPLDGTVTLPVGNHRLRWHGQTLITPIFDYPPWHLVAGELVEWLSKKATIGLKGPARRAAAKALVELFLELGIEGATSGVDWFLLDGIPTPANGWDVVNNSSQTLRIYDRIPPVISLKPGGQSDFTVEATQVGGEYLRDHIARLRDSLDVTDACDRRPILSYNGPSFMPVGENTIIRWTARDQGPTNIDGGFNTDTFEQIVRVRDTLPPIVVPPAGRVIESAGAVSTTPGTPLVFDLADVRPTVANDAPASFPADSRTLVTWSATDASGNATTANQWITVKSPGTNTAPAANDVNAAALSFEPVEIELTGTDNDFLSGRYDQLSFAITEPPANGFFVAPLFPYFIEDHRVENAFGLPRQEWQDLLRANCNASSSYEPPVDFVTSPTYMSVDDDGIAYVADQYFVCRNSGFLERRPRIARFVKNTDGELEYDRQWNINKSSQDPIPHLSIGPTGTILYRGTPQDASAETVRACDPLLTDCAVLRIAVDTSTANPDRIFPTGRLSSMIADANDILYVTDGRSAVAAYDLLDVRDNQVVATLGAIAAPGDMQGGSSNFKDLALDPDGNLYVSDTDNDRVYKYAASTIVRNEDGSVDFTAGELIGWLGRCETNLTEARACNEIEERSYGYSCTNDTCGVSEINNVRQTSGSAPGQFDQPRGIAIDANGVLYVTDFNNFRVQRFTEEGFFAGEALSECDGSCFVLGDFGKPEDISANLSFFYVLDKERDLLHVFETTPITDFDDDTLQPTQTARVEYRSKNNFKGVDTFRFAVSDGLATSTPATVSIGVTRNFRPPVATEGQRFDGSEDLDLAFTMTAFDPDDDDQPNLVYTIERQPENGQITGVGPDFVYTPDPDFFGEDVFAFSVSDGLMQSEIAEAAIDVAPVNDVPTIEFARMQDGYGAGFEIKLEAAINDVDLSDRHVYGIDWGPGEPFRTGRALPPGSMPVDGEPTFIQSADGTGVIVHEATYFDTGTRTITVCVSDTPGLTALSSCGDPNVTAIASRNVDIEARVSKAIVITDNAPTSEGELGTRNPEPLVDGDPITVVFAVHNLEPNDTGTALAATGVTFSARIEPGLEIGPSGLIAIAGDATGTNCSLGQRTIDCTVESIPVAGQARIAVELVGDGSIAVDTTVPVVAMVTSAEPDHNEMVGNAKGYPLTPNPDGDADGDGVINSEDLFPADPTESSDFDLDGVGDNADLDDDNDGIDDAWEERFGFDPRDASDASFDGDADLLTNAEEFANGTRPDTADSDRDLADDGSDNCPIDVNHNQYDQDADGIGDVCDADHVVAAAALGDVDGSGGADYAVVRTTDGIYRAYVKDGDGNVSIGAGTIELGASGRRLVAIAAASADLAALLTDAGGTAVRLVDARSGSTRFETVVFDAAWRPVAMLAGDAEIWVAASGSAELARVDSANGNVLGRIAYSEGLAPLDIAAASAGGNAVLLGRDTVSGDIVAEVRAVADGMLIGAAVPAGPETISAHITGTGSGFAVATQGINGGVDVTTYTGDGTPDAGFGVFDADWTLLALDALPAWSGSGPALAVTAVSTGGAIEARVFAASDGSQVSSRSFAGSGETARATTVAATPTGSDIGVVYAGADNAVVLGLSAAEGDDANARNVTAETSAAPPSPPPPPPPGGGGNPPPASGGGGGGGSFGVFLLGLASLATLGRRRRRNR